MKTLKIALIAFLVLITTSPAISETNRLPLIWGKEGLIRISTEDKVIMSVDDSGKRFYDLFDVKTGDSVWKRDSQLAKASSSNTGSLWYMQKKPIYNDQIYYTTTTATRNGFLTTFDAYDMITGKKLWDCDTGNLEPPMAFQGNQGYCIIKSEIHKFAQLNLDDGKVTKIFEVEDKLEEGDDSSFPILPLMVVNDKLLFVKNYLYCFDLKSEKIIWKTRDKSCMTGIMDTEYPHYYGEYGLQIYKNTLLSTDYDCQAKPRPRRPIAISLFSTDLDTGKDLWKVECNTGVVHVKDNILYYMWQYQPSEDINRVIAMSLTTGKILWDKDIELRWPSNSFIHNDYLFIEGRQIEKGVMSNRKAAMFELATGDYKIYEFPKDYTRSLKVGNYFVVSNDYKDYITKNKDDHYETWCFKLPSSYKIDHKGYALIIKKILVAIIRKLFLIPPPATIP